jgi:O-acetyl-ADP-ribose deacetylase (regulator of RNase III)
MGKINYVIGDATQPQGEGKKIICHICNDIGAWGAGFVLAISKRWSYPEQFYRARQGYPLGHADILKVEDDIYVANMIGQHRTGFDKDGNPPIRYTSVADALFSVNKVAEEMGATLHMPRIGCGLAGGEWSVIEAILKEFVTVDVTVYDLK